MILLLILLVSILLFFPFFWLLDPVFGQNLALVIAAFMMFIGLPSLLFLKWKKRSTNLIIKASNFLFAIIVLALLSWVIYRLIFVGSPIPHSLGLIGIYGYLAVIFINNGCSSHQTEQK